MTQKPVSYAGAPAEPKRSGKMRAAYMRDYMRKKRAADKAAKADSSP